MKNSDDPIMNHGIRLITNITGKAHKRLVNALRALRIPKPVAQTVALIAAVTMVIFLFLIAFTALLAWKTWKEEKNSKSLSEIAKSDPGFCHVAFTDFNDDQIFDFNDDQIFTLNEIDAEQLYDPIYKDGEFKGWKFTPYGL